MISGINSSFRSNTDNVKSPKMTENIETSDFFGINDNDEIQNSDNFTKSVQNQPDEKHFSDIKKELEQINTYLDGEDEIDKIAQSYIKMAPERQNDPAFALKCEVEVRKMYMKNHPEYAKVCEKYIEMEDEAALYLNDKLAQWEEQNSPVNDGPLKNETLYQAKKLEFVQKTIEEYRQNNPEYDYFQSRKEGREKINMFKSVISQLNKLNDENGSLLKKTAV